MYHAWVSNWGGEGLNVRPIKITGKVSNVLAQTSCWEDEFEKTLEGEAFVCMVTITFVIGAIRLPRSDFDWERDGPYGVCLNMRAFEYARIEFVQSRFSIFRDSSRNRFVKASRVSVLDFLKFNNASTLTSLALLKADWAMKSCEGDIGDVDCRRVECVVYIQHCAPRFGLERDDARRVSLLQAEGILMNGGWSQKSLLWGGFRGG
ncbi:hypothetical protein GIB67_015427 [Kingdonia uniflora]|uniref:Uncharacterized protein n=1 Tax=Kingdonia uniflora TaxID=39325 RepID=A0A7J7KZ67_9MAGN|nr:hypothetical protein GIB67_015427 [Kingdonia uniflora]